MTLHFSEYKHVGWTIGYECNFRCPYCFVWRDASSKDLKLSVDEWIKIWDRINLKYGKCFINLSGGEPTLYPGFFDIVKHLSKNNICNICTNFSWDPKILIPEISKYNLQISASFHPSFMEFDEIYKKVKYSKEYLSRSSITYVAYDKQLKDIPFYKKEFEKIGVKLIINPLRDEGFVVDKDRVINTDTSKGQQILNDIEDKKFLEQNTFDNDPYRLGSKSSKGKLCRSGKDGFCIWPDGVVNRCTRYREEIMGNISDIDFKLFDTPKRCGKDFCLVEYFMIIEE